MEIDLNDDAGHAAGQKLHLQQKSGDSHLTPRQPDDDATVFQIKSRRHVSYWMNQESRVLPSVQDSTCEVR